MPSANCRSCRTQINYGPKHAGKAVKCPQCSQPVLLPEIRPEPTSETPAPDLGYGLAPKEAAPASPPGALPAALANTSASTRQSMPSSLRTERIQRTFWADAKKSFTFLSEMDNAIVVIGYAVMMTLYSILMMLPMLLAGIFALILTVVFYGMLFAFYFDIVQTTAGGEDDLPSLMEWDGFYDSALSPVIRFVGTIAIAMLPAVVLRIALGWEIDQVEAIFVYALVALGWFFWPVIVLAVSTLGYGLVFRVDLLVRTPFTAIGAYLVVGALLVTALFFEFLGSSAFYDDTTDRMMDAMRISGGSLPWFLFRIFETFVLHAISISSSVISMRLIGLFYRHFSHRFPWSAG